jgi:biotin operon repressor
MKKELKCRFCEKPVNKDTAALNKKIINRNQPKNAMVCLTCLAETLECTVEDLQDKIEEYKQEGCTLFE